MLAFLKKLKKKKDFKKLLFLLFIVVFLFLLILNVKIAWQRKLLSKQVDSLEEEFEGLEIKRNKFSEEMLKSGNEEYLEEVARQDFNLQKEGESVVVFPLEDKESTSTEETENKGNFWQKVLGIFGLGK